MPHILSFHWAVPLLLQTFLAEQVDGARPGFSPPAFGLSFVDPPFFKVLRKSRYVDIDATTTTRSFIFGSTTPSPTLEPNVSSLPLQNTSVDAHVANGVAHVRVTQTYSNNGEECIDSQYVFPLPSQAAITAMTMIVGDRTVVGQIRTTEQARLEFETAQAQGQRSGLLEQEQPDVFAMELANILPGDVVQVAVEYVETLVPIDGAFAFTFPKVVGPQYGDDWENGAVAAESNLDVIVMLEVEPRCLGVESDLPLQVVNSTTSTQAIATGTATDVIVKFWFTEQDFDSQLLITENGEDRFYSLAIQPPQRQLLNSSETAEREYVFLLDLPGSMSGYEMNLSKALMRQLLQEHMHPGDRFNVVLFAGWSEVLNESGSVEATDANLAYAEAWLDNNTFNGSTGIVALLPALKRAYDIPQSSMTGSRILVIMTDGYVTAEKDAFDMLRNQTGQVNVFVFGIGHSVNRPMIEGLARFGHGRPFIVANESEGMSVLEQLRLYIDSPVLTNLNLSFSGGFTPLAQEPPYLPDLFASRPIQVVGKWSGSLEGEVRLQGDLANGSLWEYVANLSQIQATDSSVIRSLWARSRISFLTDCRSLSQLSSDDQLVFQEEVTELGLNYSLLTAFTSFVAVDSNPVDPEVCGSEGSGSTTTRPTTTTTDRYGFGSDDDDDNQYSGEDDTMMSDASLGAASPFGLMLAIAHALAHMILAIP